MCGEPGLVLALPGLPSQPFCGLPTGETTVTWTVAASGEVGVPHRRREGEVIGGLAGAAQGPDRFHALQSAASGGQSQSCPLLAGRLPVSLGEGSAARSYT